MLIHLFADPVAHLAKRKLLRLFTGIKPVIGHAGFTKRFDHFGKVLFACPRLRRHTKIGQAITIVIERVFRLLNK
ncbi:hypothetical protein CF204P1_20740 [Citrobacter freundii]|nr:hypothetical protein CF204P1_20740 [Citrobacter freundii]